MSRADDIRALLDAEKNLNETQKAERQARWHFRTVLFTMATSERYTKDDLKAILGYDVEAWLDPQYCKEEGMQE